VIILDGGTFQHFVEIGYELESSRYWQIDIASKGENGVLYKDTLSIVDYKFFSC
jgi:hypothetical protein